MFSCMIRHLIQHKNGTIYNCISFHNKATRSPEISRKQVQKLTPQFLLYIIVGNFDMKLTGRWFPQIVDRNSGNLYPIYIYIGYRFPLFLSTIWGNHLPVNFMSKFPTIWRNHLPHLTTKWRGTFEYFQSHDKMPYIYYLEKPDPI